MPSATHSLYGGGGGGKGGSASAAHAAVEDANTLRSSATAFAKDLWATGPIFGFYNQANPLNNVYLNEVPLINEDGSSNYTGYTYAYRLGYPVQDYVPSDYVESPLVVPGAVVLGPGGSVPARPWTGAITDSSIDAVRLLITIPSLTKLDPSTGDLHGNTVDVRVELRQTTGADVGYHQLFHDTITGKVVSTYERAYKIDLPKPGPWQIRVSRDTSEATTSNEQKSLSVKGLVALQYHKYSYPGFAYFAINMDAAYFSGSIPKRQYLLKGALILVPDNYDPDARIYSGVWGGGFKYSWTNNPAWIFYDLLTNATRGLGNELDINHVDKWGIYQIGQYCDGWQARASSGTTNDFTASGVHGVPNGSGGFEPRFTFNANINVQKDAYQVLQAVAASFRGMTYWGSGFVNIVQDSPKNPVQLLAPANVEGGMFTYASSRLTDRHTVCHVGYTNPDDFYKPDFVVAENLPMLQKYGYRETSIVALGCTSASQAYRLGKWLVETEWAETETVTYTCGLDQLLCRPGDIIKIADPSIAGARFGGRIIESSPETIGNASSQLMPNPTFATGSVGNWVSDSADKTTVSAMPVLRGDMPWRYALNISDSSAVHIYPIIDIQRKCNAGETLYTSCWIDTTDQAQPLYFALLFYNAANAFVSIITGCASYGSTPWHFVAGSLVVPANATYFSVRLYFNTAVVAKTFNVQVNQIWIAREPAFLVSNVASAFTVDSPVTLEGGDTVTVVKRDGTLMNGNITYAYGDLTTLVVEPAFSEIPAKNSMWAIEGGVTHTTKWRVMSVKEVKHHQFEVSATQYDETKFAKIEFGVSLPKQAITRLSAGIILPPTNFNTVETLYRTNNQVRSRLDISWSASRDANGNMDSRVSGYHVDWLPPGGNWLPLMDTVPAGIDLPDVVPGVYSFRIFTQTPFGRSNSALEATGIQIYGKSIPPHDVANFVATPKLGGILLTWDEVTDIDVIGYEIREGASWDAGLPITLAMKGTALYVPVTDIYDHTYYIKAIGDSIVAGIPKYSVNAAAVTSSVLAPDSVTVFSAQPQGDNILFNWEPVAGNDIQYDIRAGTSWVFGDKVWSGTGTSAVIVYPGTGLVTFWIKSRSKAGLYCKIPLFAQCTMSNLLRNYLLQNDSAANGWSGNKRNVAYEAATNSLAVQQNLFIDGKSVNHTTWEGNGTFTPNIFVGPNGVTYATRFVEGNFKAGDGIGIDQLLNFVAGKAYAVSANFKPLLTGNKRWATLLTPASAFGAYYTLTLDTVTGDIVTTSANIAVTAVTNLGNGWWQLAAVIVATQTATGHLGWRFSSTAGDNYGNQAGDSVSGLYIDNVSCIFVGEPVYGEYFEEFDLTQVVRARNWLDSEFLMLDANTLTWQTSTFAWLSNSADTTSWIANGDDSGATALRTLATKWVTPPTSFIDAFEFNGSLTSYTGASTLVLSKSITYTPHLARNGVTLGPYGQARYNFVTPSVFATRFTLTLNLPDIEEEGLFRIVDANYANGMYLQRHADGSFSLLSNAGNLTIPTLTRTIHDYVTFVVQQTTTTRTFAAYSHRTGDYRIVSQNIAPFATGVLRFFEIADTNAVSALEPTVYGNFQFYGNTLSISQIKLFATGGKTPPGYNDFVPLVVGDYTYQQGIIGLQMGAPPGSGRPAMDHFTLHIDVPNLSEFGSVNCLDSGYVTVPLYKPWTRAAHIIGYQTSGTAITAVDIINITLTSFQIRLRNPAGNAIAGNVAYQCGGF